MGKSGDLLRGVMRRILYKMKRGDGYDGDGKEGVAVKGDDVTEGFDNDLFRRKGVRAGICDHK